MRRRRAIATLAILALALVAAAFAEAEVAQKDGVRVRFEGNLAPQALPRHGSQPVRVAIGAKIAALKASKPPKLTRIAIAINSAGRFDPRGLPVCTVPEIQPSTTQNALRACGASLVGTGRFAAKVLLPQQTSFPAGGKLYAFNGRFDGRPAILAHVYGTDPVPTSFTLPFVVTNGKGALGTTLTASLSGATGRGGYITELALDLGGSGRRYLTASCPAPKGFNRAVFPFARATFDFAGATLTSTLVRSCKVRG